MGLLRVNQYDEDYLVKTTKYFWFTFAVVMDPFIEFTAYTYGNAAVLSKTSQTTALCQQAMMKVEVDCSIYSSCCCCCFLLLVQSELDNVE